MLSHVEGKRIAPVPILDLDDVVDVLLARRPAAVRTENLAPDVVVMKFAKDRI
jgi:hypothetical protein